MTEVLSRILTKILSDGKSHTVKPVVAYYLLLTIAVFTLLIVEKTTSILSTGLNSLCVCCKHPKEQKCFSNDIFAEMTDLRKEVNQTKELLDKVSISVRRNSNKKFTYKSQ